MKWINAEQQVTVTIYDEEHEEYLDKIMTVEETLDTYTSEGCPTIYSNPERKKGKWRHYEGYLTCSECGVEYDDDIMTHCCDDVPKFCPNCGADMRGEQNG